MNQPTISAERIAELLAELGQYSHIEQASFGVPIFELRSILTELPALRAQTQGSEAVAHVSYTPMLDVSWTDPIEAIKLKEGAPLYATPPAPVDGVDVVHGWKCNCCRTEFSSAQKARKINDNNGGPRCPTCKADGQFTYRNDLHDGDPCKKCGIKHDRIYSGPCVRYQSQLLKDLCDAAAWRRLPGEENHHATLALLERAISALATPPAPVDGGATDALSKLVDAVSNMRVPQNIAEAGIQVMLTLGPALENARAALTAAQAAVAQDETP